MVVNLGDRLDELKVTEATAISEALKQLVAPHHPSSGGVFAKLTTNESTQRIVGQ